VAEIGSNHCGNYKLAQTMVKAAAAAGIEWIKFQAYKTENFLHPQSPYFAELKREELPLDDFERLVDLAHSLNLKVGLTIFCCEGLELARKCGADFIKISSGDLTYCSLIEAASQSGLPLVLSTGASNEVEVCCALKLTGKNLLALLQCTSLYPAPLEFLDLAVITHWLAMGRPAGFSDHSLGPAAAQCAVALGAVMVEKHVTTDRTLNGGDNFMSATLEEFRAIWAPQQIREPKLLGSEIKAVKPGEEPDKIRRVAVAVRNIELGENIYPSDILFLRPPDLTKQPLRPNQPLSSLKARCRIPQNQPLYLSDLDGLPL
jgi:N-acetylneuraminate synthase